MMKEWNTIAAIIVALGLSLAPAAVLADEEKGGDAHKARHADTNSQAHEGVKEAEKGNPKKAKTAEGGSAEAHPHDEGSQGDNEEEEEEGSH